MMTTIRQDRALGPVAGAVNGLMRSSNDQDQAAALNRISACAVVTSGELGRLNATNQKMLSVQHEIAAKQQQLVHLGHEQVRLQSAMLNVQTQQLVVQKQQLVVQQISALNLEVQTRIHQQQSILRERQRHLKDAAFESKQRVVSLSAIPDPVERFVLLSQFAASIDVAGLSPSELEEIGDKQYVQSMLDDLSGAISATVTSLSADEARDVQFFLSNVGARRHLEAASVAASANVAGLSVHQARLHQQIANVDKRLSGKWFADRFAEKWPRLSARVSTPAVRAGIVVLAGLLTMLALVTRGPFQAVCFVAAVALVFVGWLFRNERAHWMRQRAGLVAQLAQLDHQGNAAAHGAATTEAHRAALNDAVDAFVSRHPGLRSFL